MKGYKIALVNHGSIDTLDGIFKSYVRAIILGHKMRHNRECIDYIITKTI